MLPLSSSAPLRPSRSPGDDDDYEGGFVQDDNVDDDHAVNDDDDDNNVDDNIDDDVSADVHDVDDNGDVPHLLHVRLLSPLALELVISHLICFLSWPGVLGRTY